MSYPDWLSSRLYYIHDPMCSWCWGFSRTWLDIRRQLPGMLKLEYVLGGLAPDNDEAMPVETQTYVQENWQRIQQQIPGVEFNYDFWTQCQPKRSTYPACRAVLAAKQQSAASEQAMIEAIQHAYYLKAQNPSEDAVLIDLAAEIGLDIDVFKADFYDPERQYQLDQHISHYQSLSLKSGAKGFPSLVLQVKDCTLQVPIDYLDAAVSVRFIQQHLERLGIHA